MDAPKKAALLWSGGKYSALALHHARKSHLELQVVQLVTCVSQAYDRVSMHGVRRQLVEEQADALGLPVEFVVVPSPSPDGSARATKTSTPGTDFSSNDAYARTMLAAFSRLKQEGVQVVLSGDVYLEDLRAYRDGLLAAADLRGRYPLWGRDARGLYGELLTLGYRAVTVCVDGQRLSEGHCGRALTADFLDSLPAGTDPCGE